jgi:hypothetical protein
MPKNAEKEFTCIADNGNSCCLAAPESHPPVRKHEEASTKKIPFRVNSNAKSKAPGKWKQLIEQLLGVNALVVTSSHRG